MTGLLNGPGCFVMTSFSPFCLNGSLSFSCVSATMRNSRSDCWHFAKVSKQGGTVRRWVTPQLENAGSSSHVCSHPSCSFTSPWTRPWTPPSLLLLLHAHPHPSSLLCCSTSLQAKMNDGALGDQVAPFHFVLLRLGTGCLCSRWQPLQPCHCHSSSSCSAASDFLPKWNSLAKIKWQIGKTAGLHGKPTISKLTTIYCNFALWIFLYPEILVSRDTRISRDIRISVD